VSPNISLVSAVVSVLLKVHIIRSTLATIHFNLLQKAPSNKVVSRLDLLLFVLLHCDNSFPA